MTGGGEATGFFCLSLRDKWDMSHTMSHSRRGRGACTLSSQSTLFTCLLGPGVSRDGALRHRSHQAVTQGVSRPAGVVFQAGAPLWLLGTFLLTFNMAQEWPRLLPPGLSTIIHSVVISWAPRLGWTRKELERKTRPWAILEGWVTVTPGSAGSTQDLGT